jgi:Zn-dependent peptidase ImmA (M78 family)/transcriptional regulator with XRE-family HTH domain
MVVNNRLLRLAREARGWTQKRLAADSGIAQGSLSKYEKGLQTPSETQLESIAAALDYPVGFFLQTEARPTTVLYRTRSLRSAKLEGQVRARLNLARLVAGRLLDDMTVDSVTRFPEPDQTYDSPAQAAAVLRTAWGVVPGPVDSVSELIEYAGGVVVRVDLGTDQAIAAYLHPLGDPIRWFFVNSRVHSGDRIRFSLAHELAHAVLHEAALIPDSREAELHANQFAGAFLLPAADLLAELPRRRMDLQALLTLKQHFGVSMQAAAMTAHQAGAISQDELTRLYRELSYRGWRTAEPGQVAVEQPTVLRDALAVHRGEHGYSEAELAELAQVSPATLADLLPDYFSPPGGRHLRVVSRRPP